MSRLIKFAPLALLWIVSSNAGAKPLPKEREGDPIIAAWDRSLVGDWARYCTIGTNRSRYELRLTLSKRENSVLTLNGENRYVSPDAEHAGEGKWSFDSGKAVERFWSLESKLKNAKLISRGKESISCGGRNYHAEWFVFKTPIPGSDNLLESEHKVWYSPSAPLSGLLKEVRTTPQGTFVTELTESGTGAR